MALSWTLHSTNTGYKVIKASVTDGIANSAIVVKNDGSILKPVADANSFTGVDQQYLSTTLLYVSISDTITDFAGNFITNPYKLHYKYSTVKYHVQYYNDDQTKPIMSTNSKVYLPESTDQIEESYGIIFNEIISPKQNTSNGTWLINEKGIIATAVDTPLTNIVKSFIGVYKNDKRDTNWVVTTNTSNQNGSVYLVCSNKNYDSTAIYTVTYEILNKYNYTPNFGIQVSNPTVQKAYSYLHYATNGHHNVGFFSFLSALFTSVAENKQIAISKGTLKGFSVFYDHLPLQGIDPANTTYKILAEDEFIHSTDLTTVNTQARNIYKDPAYILENNPSTLSDNPNINSFVKNRINYEYALIGQDINLYNGITVTCPDLIELSKLCYKPYLILDSNNEIMLAIVSNVKTDNTIGLSPTGQVKKLYKIEGRPLMKE